MAITAQSKGTTKREVIPAGNYVAVCYEMVEIGLVQFEWQGEKKELHKVRITWELSNELREFDGVTKPMVISKEYTLSMHEKSTLRKHLESWRGKGFTDDQAKGFDITKLLSAPCMLNIIHSEKGYAQIASISPIVKGLPLPKQHNDNRVLSYDSWNEDIFNSLPDFIKDKIKTSKQYKEITSGDDSKDDEDLPF